MGTSYERRSPAHVTLGTLTRDEERALLENYAAVIDELIKAKPTTLAEAMADWEDMDFDFGNLDEGLLPLDDINL